MTGPDSAGKEKKQRNGAPDYGLCLVVTGIMGHILIQVILNIAVVTNTIPNTGITLPFVSYGGTSVLFLLSEMGLALNISRSHPHGERGIC